MIQWTEALATGDERIDRDHRKLISCINDLEDSVRCWTGAGKLASSVNFLALYAKEHFAREEACMFRAKCPAHRTNCAAHAVFLDRIERWVAQVNGHATQALALEIYIDSSNWLLQHIAKVDSKLRDVAAVFTPEIANAFELAGREAQAVAQSCSEDAGAGRHP